MRLCRFNLDRVGVVRGDAVHDVSAILSELPAMRWPLPPGDALIARLAELRPRMEMLADAAPPRPRSPDPFTSFTIACGDMRSARSNPRHPPVARYSLSESGSIRPTRANVMRCCWRSHGTSSASPRLRG